MSEQPTLSRRRLIQAGSALMGLSAFGLTADPGKAPALHFDDGLEALKKALKGRLLLPGDMGYAMAAFPNNARWADVRPRAIAMCADEKDVQLCVKWLRDQPAEKERFAIRSGGHNYAGFSTTEGLLIDVKAMKGVKLDEKNNRVTIQGGVNNQDMADAMHQTKFAVPSGRCPTVGASGLVLGGGWGFAATHGGLTCDALHSTDLVLANGELVTASETNHRDLFWALRGGGGGNFGVNTSFTFNLHSVGRVTIFNITWPGPEQIELLNLLQDIQLKNPTTISTRTKALPPDARPYPERKNLQVTTLGLFWGELEDAYQVLAPVLCAVKPLSVDIRTMNYWQARDYLITDDPTGMYDIRSSFVGERMSDQGLENMLQWMCKWPGGSLLPENMGILFAIGGKVRDLPADATAYVHRNANFIFEMECSWAPIDRPETVAAQQRWLTDYFAAMQPYLLPQSYVNFPNRDLPNWAQAYYGKNLDRLSKVKWEYDRDNFFRFEQSIPLPT